MRPKYLLLVLLLVTQACKVTEKDIAGFYQQKNDKQCLTLILYPDHTFYYYYFNSHAWYNTEAKKDSCNFINRGNWKYTQNGLILDSYNNFKDTARIRKVSHGPAASKESSFIFKTIAGETIRFSEDDLYLPGSQKVNQHSIFDADFTSDKLLVVKNDTAEFDLIGYRTLRYVIDTDTPSSYTITLSPYYKQSVFNNQVVSISKSKVFIDSVKFKKHTNPKTIPEWRITAK
jgi:hypothetical protein